MDLKEQLNGIQHIGIPTNDIEKTIDFYQTLGFEIAFRTVNEEVDEKVAFLKLNTLVVETYENKAAKMEAGAIKFVLLRQVGEAYIDRTVTEAEMEEALEWLAGGTHER